MLHIHPIPAFQDNYIWMPVSSTSGHCVVVDPGDAKPVLERLTLHQLTLKAILITHHHKDHTGGILELLDHVDVPVFGPDESVKGVTHIPTEGEALPFDTLGLTFEVISIPGHTRGHVAYYGNGLLFSGDTLFTGACGRLFEGTAAQMYASLNKLAALPDETLVYCGHEYTEGGLAFARHIEPDNLIVATRIEETARMRRHGIPTVPAPLFLEKQTNPFLRCQEKTIIAAAEKHLGHQSLTPEKVFASIRQQKDVF